MSKKELEAVIKVGGALDASLKTTMSQAKSYINDLNKTQKAFAQNAQSQFQALGKKLTSVGDNMQVIGKKFAPISAAAAAGLGSSIKMASDFQDAMAKVNTIAGLSSGKLSKLSTDLLKVSSDTGKNASEITEAAYQSLSASVPTDKVVQFTKTAANLGKTGFATTAEAVNVLTTEINAYGLKTSDAQKLSDQLIQTQNRGKTTVQELANQMGNVIPTAAALGVNISNLNTGYIQLTKQGINTATATTQMRAMFNELSKSGTKVDAILRSKTGKGFSDLMKSGKSLGDVMQLLGDSVNGDTNKFKDLWSNSRAGAGALALLNAGSKDFNKQLKDMENSTGNVSKALETMQTPGAKARKAINQLKNSAIEFGTSAMDALAPTITKAANLVEKLTAKFDKLPKSTKQTIAKIAGLTAVFSPAMIIVGKFASRIGKLIEKFPTFGGKIKEIGTMFQGFGGGLKGILSGLASPIGIVVIAVGVLTAAFVHLWKTNEQFRKAIGGIWSQITTTVGGFIGQVGQRINSVIKFFSQFKAQASAIWNGFCNLLAPVFVAAFQVIADTVKSITQVIIGVMDVIGGIFTGDFSGVVNGLKEIFSGLLEFVKSVFMNIGPLILQALAGLGNIILSLGGMLLSAIGSLLSMVGNAILTFITNLPQMLINGLFAIINFVIQTVVNGGVLIFNTLSTAFTAIFAFFASLPGKIITFITSIPGRIKTVFATAGTWAMTAVSNLITGVITFFSSLPGKIISFISGIPEKVKSVFTTTKSNATSAVKGLISGIISFFASLPGKIWGVIKSIPGKIASAFKIKLPKIKLPHFSVGSKQVGPVKVPTLSVKWNAEGGVFKKPTIFNTPNAGMQGVGEAGPEAIMPLNTLWSKMKSIVGNVVTQASNARAKDSLNPYSITNIMNRDGYSLGAAAGATTNSKVVSYDFSGLQFKPEIHVNGSTDKKTIIDALREYEDEFMDMLEEFIKQKESEKYA